GLTAMADLGSFHAGWLVDPARRLELLAPRFGWARSRRSKQHSRFLSAKILNLRNLIFESGLIPRDIGSVSRSAMKASPEFRKQLAGYGLTTAEILYRMPDHPTLLQS